MPNSTDIERLIPQRSPILMVDELLEATDEKAICQLTLRADNFFMQFDGTLAEVGIIEHIAQSASALAGYKAIKAGATRPPVGYIGEVKNFHLYQIPVLGDVLRTTVTMGPTVQGVSIVWGTTQIGDQVVADTQLKIFVKEETET